MTKHLRKPLYLTLRVLVEVSMSFLNKYMYRSCNEYVLMTLCQNLSLLSAITVYKVCVYYSNRGAKPFVHSFSAILWFGFPGIMLVSGVILKGLSTVSFGPGIGSLISGGSIALMALLQYIILNMRIGTFGLLAALTSALCGTIGTILAVNYPLTGLFYMYVAIFLQAIKTFFMRLADERYKLPLVDQMWMSTLSVCTVLAIKEFTQAIMRDGMQEVKVVCTTLFKLSLKPIHWLHGILPILGLYLTLWTILNCTPMTLPFLAQVDGLLVALIDVNSVDVWLMSLLPISEEVVSLMTIKKSGDSEMLKIISQALKAMTCIFFVLEKLMASMAPKSKLSSRQSSVGTPRTGLGIINSTPQPSGSILRAVKRRQSLLSENINEDIFLCDKDYFGELSRQDFCPETLPVSNKSSPLELAEVDDRYGSGGRTK